MKDVLTAPWLVELVRTCTNMYAHGWDERNGGNISLRLDASELKEYLDPARVLRAIPTGFSAPERELVRVKPRFADADFDFERDAEVKGVDHRVADNGAHGLFLLLRHVEEKFVMDL